MDDRVKAAFDAVYADEELKSKTRAFIAQKTHGYQPRRAARYRKILSAAAACCLAVVALAGAWLYFTPTAQIDIEINPSLELGINRFDRVVSVNPLNDDGKKLAQSLDIRFASYDAALRKILDEPSVEAMLSKDEVMTVTVVKTNANAAQSDAVLSQSRACAKGRGNVYCHAADPDEVSAARELGLPCGKYRAFLELQALDPTVTPEAIRNLTVRQIRELIADLSGGEGGGNAESPAAGGGNGHHGNGNGNGNGNSNGSGNGRGHKYGRGE